MQLISNQYRVILFKSSDLHINDQYVLQISVHSANTVQVQCDVPKPTRDDNDNVYSNLLQWDTVYNGQVDDISRWFMVKQLWSL